MIETQNQFDGGINTRLPAHQIGANQLTEAVDVDLSHGDLRGHYGMVAGSNREFFYEAGDTWISDEGTQGAETIYNFPVNTGGTAFVAGTGYSLSNSNKTLTTTQSLNFFRGDIPQPSSGDGEFIVAEGHTVTIFDVTRGIHGANSFVEYSKDLYISRSDFTIQNITWTYNSTTPVKTLTTGAETYKLQIGDMLSHANLPVGVVVVDVDDASDTIVISEATLAAESSGATVSVKPIISKYLDGDTTTSSRVGAQQPIPVTTYQQIDTNSSRGGSHSASWYTSIIPIPYQYFLSFYDESGNESKISDGTSIALGTTNFPSTLTNTPQYINFGDIGKSITRATSTSSRNGRYALYRVGGTSAIIKRCANLFLTENVNVQTDTPTSNKLRIRITGCINTHRYKVRWYAYNSKSYTYSPTDYVNAIAGDTEFKLGSDLNNSSVNNFQLEVNSGTAHYADLQVIMQIPGETVERDYVVTALTHHNANVSGHSRATGVAPGLGVCHDFIDWLTPDALADIQPIEEEKSPTRSLTNLIESNNIFFGIKENRVYASEYGNPNGWPEYGFIDFDQPVTGLGKLTGELVAFTEFGVHRIFGSDPLNLRKVQIPTVEGVPAGLDKGITSFSGGVMFASHNGICFYNGTGVRVISENIINDYSNPNSTTSNNAGGVYDNTFYLLGATGGGNGYKVDLKTGAIRITNTTMKASALFYRGASAGVNDGNTLYGYDPTSNNVTINYLAPGSSATRTTFSAKTREFTGGDINSEKMFYNASISGTGFNGTVEIIVDGVTTDTFSVSGVSSSEDFHRTFYTATPRTGNGALIRLSNASGQVNKISVNSDLKNQLKRMLFSSVTIIYTGTPTVQLFVDGTSKISATTLSAPTGNAGEATLYFPAMTTGVVPHFRETGNEASGRVVSFQYSATPA